MLVPAGVHGDHRAVDRPAVHGEVHRVDRGAEDPQAVHPVVM